MRGPDLRSADYSPAQAARLLKVTVGEVLKAIRKPDGLTAYRFRGERRLRISASSLAAYRLTVRS